MSAPRAACWSQLPRYSGAVARLRNVLALDEALAPGTWISRHGFSCRMALASPLPAYALWLTLDGASGSIGLGLECASVLPELGADVIAAIEGDDQRMLALEWLLMPWLDDLERLTGCHVRIAALSFWLMPPPQDLLALALRGEDGRLAHIALSGGGLAALAAACGRPRMRLPAWGRIAAVWLLRAGSLSLEEVRALTRGALLRLAADDLYVRMGRGGKRMAAHWQEDGSVVVDGLAAPGGGEAPALAEEASLVGIDELTFDVDVVLATQSLTVEQAGALCRGAVLPLAHPADGQRVSLVHQGRTFARGDLVYVDDMLAVMITECADAAP